MERVNLLPEEAQLGVAERLLQLVERDFLQVLVGVVGAVVTIGFILWVSQSITLKRNQKRLDALKREIEILQVESQNLESFSKQLDQVESELIRQKKLLDWKVEFLKAARSQPRKWAELLKDLRRNIPRGMWLSELETGPQNSLRIAGGATDENLVSQFMSNLKDSPYFSNVGFTYTEKGAIGNVPIVKFEIVCRVG